MRNFLLVNQGARPRIFGPFLQLLMLWQLENTTKSRPDSDLSGFWREGPEQPQHHVVYFMGFWASSIFWFPKCWFKDGRTWANVGVGGWLMQERRGPKIFVFFFPQITLTNLVSVNERLVYTPHPENPEMWVIMSQGKNIQLWGRGGGWTLPLIEKLSPFSSCSFKDKTHTGSHHHCDWDQPW